MVLPVQDRAEQGLLQLLHQLLHLEPVLVLELQLHQGLEVEQQQEQLEPEQGVGVEMSLSRKRERRDGGFSGSMDPAQQQNRIPDQNRRLPRTAKSPRREATQQPTNLKTSTKQVKQLVTLQ